MEKRLEQVLNNQGGNYILPFYWQHGEDEADLRLGMEKINEAGIGAVCIESRPHPDFLGEKWWHDVDIIMEEARKRNMKVWVLDDSHFPSGYANGAVKHHPEAAKRYITHYCIDAVGPMEKASFMICLEEGEKLVSIIAGRRDRKDQFALSDTIDLTSLAVGNLLYWDIPEGFWCITVIKTTNKGMGRADYINPIDKGAVKLFIETVYEAHYSHYKNDFGKTFAGFFSDEPELGNAAGGKYGHRATIGSYDLTLSWSNELQQKLIGLWEESYGIMLAALWHNIEGTSHKARYDYMNFVSSLYGTHFCGQIGDWCRSHGVEYIGHVIEDGNCHSATGLGTGHFFRALWGQDMSGIDVVLQQIRPELDDTGFYRIGGTQFYYGQFFHYALAKLGASLGHMDEKKKGRTMCEIFGAYGWVEGLKMMKWLTDHMLVRGINHFVPHAFTMKDFPDPDCPPHFYAKGDMNPEYPYFKYLMNYMNRVSHLINGGLHVPNVAILYDAESDWAGEYEPVECAGKILAQNQIDYEVVPADVLEKCSIKNGEMLIGKELCKALIIPKCEYIPRKVIEWCNKAKKQGFTVLCFDKAPKAVEDDEYLSTEIISEEELIEALRNIGAYEIELSNKSKDLRYYHYKQESADFYLFFNESQTKAIHTSVKLGCNGKPVYRYDAFDNRIYKPKVEEGGLNLDLEPYEAYIAVIGEVEESKLNKPLAEKEDKVIAIENPWKLTLREVGKEAAAVQETVSDLYDITAPNHMPYFTGTMDYENTLYIDNEVKEAFIDLGKVYESAEVWINGRPAGVRIAPPYKISITDLIKQGENHIKIRVVNNLAHRQRDFFSMNIPMEPSGLLGPVLVNICEK